MLNEKRLEEIKVWKKGLNLRQKISFWVNGYVKYNPKQFQFVCPEHGLVSWLYLPAGFSEYLCCWMCLEDIKKELDPQVNKILEVINATPITQNLREFQLSKSDNGQSTQANRLFKKSELK